MIKCKTNNQQSQASLYNILPTNNSLSTATMTTTTTTTTTTIRSIDVPNEHTSIKLHIRRVCSPSSSSSSSMVTPTETSSINPTTNLLYQSNEKSPTKLVGRKFFEPDNKSSRRVITTRRTSFIESDLALINASINNHINIYDENTLKKSVTKTNGYKRKIPNDQQEKKRQKLTPKTTKQQSTTISKSYNYIANKSDITKKPFYFRSNGSFVLFFNKFQTERDNFTAVRTLPFIPRTKKLV